MYCNISWPTKIEFVVLSLNKEVDVPRILLNNLFSAIVDKLEAAKSKIFGNIEFAKTASKIIIKPLTVVKTVKSISDDLCREINTNALFVVIVYPKENERDAIMLARDLTRNFRFAIALFNKTFADVLSNPKNPSNDVVLQELERVTENLLRDVSKVIAKRAALVDVQPSSSAQNSEGVERQTAPSSVNGSLNTPAFVPQIPTQQQNRVAVSLFNGSINNFRNCSDMSRFKLTTFSVFKPVDFKVGQYYDIVVTHVTDNENENLHVENFGSNKKYPWPVFFLATHPLAVPLMAV
uniref:Uncharacterized protein n=1 Tax=Romanomermis culicivorax TaxID=13658 RepID=A0A915HXI7_ROMCU